MTLTEKPTPLRRGGAYRPRIARRIVRSVASRWPWPVRARLASGQHIYVDLRSSIGMGVLATGRFDDALAQVIRQHLRPGDTFVDVGANVGVFAVIAASIVGPQGHVHAYEVDERALRCMRRTIEREQMDNLDLHAVAIGERVGHASLIRSRDVGHTYLRYEDRRGSGFDVRPLDDWLGEFAPSGVKLVKIDIEGGELDALRGARELLGTWRPVVVLEAVESHLNRFDASVSDVERFMKDLGYAAAAVEGANDPTLIFHG